MADMTSRGRTNYFAVTDEARLRELVEGIHGAELLEVDGKFAFGCTGSEISNCYDDNGEEIDVFEEIQKILCDGEVVIAVETSEEKLRYMNGFVTIVSKDVHEVTDLVMLGMQKASELTGVKVEDLSHPSY